MKTFIVDAFTHQRFKGNPAGVCLPDSPLDETTMLRIAQELGLSETAFIRPLEARGRFSIRFFSPKMEIPLCGHATLASAKVLLAAARLDVVHFINIQNLELTARTAQGKIVLEFPVYDTRPATAPPALLSALGLHSVKNTAYNDELKILLLEIGETRGLAELKPDFSELVRSHHGINGVVVTAPSGTDGFDFHSRYFWPWSGTNEDPVTGGTHTFLAPYWSERLQKTCMRSFQSSARTGSMDLELVGDSLFVRADAVVVFEGRLVP